MQEITIEDVLSEMHERVTAIVDFFQVGISRKSAIEKCSIFLGISHSQTKCFVYRQATRVDAHVADQIRLRSDMILFEIKSVKHDYIKKREEMISRITQQTVSTADGASE
jgi:hypothetical protein